MLGDNGSQPYELVSRRLPEEILSLAQRVPALPELLMELFTLLVQVDELFGGVAEALDDIEISGFTPSLLNAFSAAALMSPC